MKDTELTTYDVHRILGIKQMTHYLHLKHSAVTIDDKEEVRRATDILNQLTTEHGVELFHKAQDKYREYY